MTDILSLIGELEYYEPTSPDDRILIIDSTNTFLRVWASVPTISSTGEHVGGVLGFLRSIGSNIRDYNPTKCIIVFDGKGGSQRRKKIFPEYKSNRIGKHNIRRQEYSSVEDEQLSMQQQMIRIIQYLDVLPVQIFCMDNIEADDVIAYMCKQCFTDSDIRIVSTDRDFLQLVDDRIEVYSPVKKKLYHCKDIDDEFGLIQENYLLYRALTGDISDNIDGVNGLGLKTLLKTCPDVINNDMDVSEFFEYVRTLKKDHPKKKILDKIIMNERKIERNYRLMQLHDVDISGNSKIRILDNLKQGPNKLNEVEFYKLFASDQLPMKYPDRWLRDTFYKLNMWT